MKAESRQPTVWQEKPVLHESRHRIAKQWYARSGRFEAYVWFRFPESLPSGDRDRLYEACVLEMEACRVQAHRERYATLAAAKAACYGIAQ